MTDRNLCLRLIARPEARAGREHFKVEEAAIPEPKEGQLVVKVSVISLDPALRGWMNENAGYRKPIPLGASMQCFAAGHVVASRNAAFQAGEAVSGLLAAERYTLSDGKGLTKIDTANAPMERWLGALGMPGATAYLGTMEILQPKAGETVAVSAASGAVGQVVGQIARILGAKAVGIAGGPEKCRRLTETFGYDAAVDYRDAAFEKKLRDATPDGIDGYFENVGGEVGDAAIRRMNTFGRIALCGLISRYNEADPDAFGFTAAAALTMLVRRLMLRGFIVLDFPPEAYEAAIAQLAAWHAEGKIAAAEDVRDGDLADFPDVLNLLYSSGNNGKLVLRLPD